MKKVTAKNELNKIVENLTIQEQGKGYEHCAPVYEYREGIFRCTIDTCNTTIEEQLQNLKKAASSLDRIGSRSSAELNRRSNKIQEVLAYIGSHRELIPFFSVLHEWTGKHPDQTAQDAVHEYRKNNTLPACVKVEYQAFRGKRAYYGLGCKMPAIAEVLEQLPYIPKAWM